MTTPFTRRRLLGGAAALALSGAAPSQAAKRKSENVVLVMTDGLRWQEMFRGLDPGILTKEAGMVDNPAPLRKRFWRETVEERRAALMPFVWDTVAKEGTLWGNQDHGSVARVTNGKNFSYPGYNEALAGFADPRIDSNAKRPNPNVTVFEWLNRKRRYAGKVAAFAAWDVFPFIFNRERCGFPVNAGFEPVEGPLSPRLELLNRLKAETPAMWSGVEPYDSFTFHSALEYVKTAKPRVLYLCLGETDEWAHEGRYADYIEAAHRADLYLGDLWRTLQSMNQYRGKTTLLFTTDHGRGDAPQGWKGHGANVPGAENIWLAAMGPDTPAAGEVKGGAPITQSQVAATVAAALGEDYPADVKQAAPPVAGAFR